MKKLITIYFGKYGMGRQISSSFSARHRWGKKIAFDTGNSFLMTGTGGKVTSYGAYQSKTNNGKVLKFKGGANNAIKKVFGVIPILASMWSPKKVSY